MLNFPILIIINKLEKLQISKHERLPHFEDLIVVRLYLQENIVFSSFWKSMEKHVGENEEIFISAVENIV